MYFYIYRTTNNINNKYYIGRHKSKYEVDLVYKGSGTAIKHALLKYGRKNFTVEVLEYCDNFEHLVLREAEIVTIELVNDPMCYNMKPGGAGKPVGKNKKPFTKVTTDETKQKQRIAALNRNKSAYVNCQGHAIHTTLGDFASLKDATLAHGRHSAGCDWLYAKLKYESTEYYYINPTNVKEIMPSKRLKDIRKETFEPLLTVGRSNSKPVITPEGVFNSVTEAANYYKITPGTMSTKIKKYPELFQLIITH